MKHLLQKRLSIFLILITVILTNQSVIGQINYTENFTSTTFPNTGWSLIPVVGNPIWSRQTTGTNPTCAPHSAGGMARFNSDQAPTGSSQALVLPLINYTNRGAANASVSFWIYRNQGPNGADSLGVLINTTNSLTGATRLGAVARSISINLPDTVPTSGWYQYSFNVPASFTAAVNYIFLNGYSRNGNNIFIDDVAWVDFPPVCTGTPSAGTISSNPAIICGGLGSALLNTNSGSIGFAGIIFQWQEYDSTSGSWINIGTGGASVSTGNITVSKYYRIYSSCSNSSLSDTSAAYLMNVSQNPLPVISTTPNNITMCPGGTPELIVATGAVSYTWAPAVVSGSVNGDSVYVSPTTNTTYVVTGTDSVGCSANTNVNVQLANAPNVNATANPDSLCSGDNTNIFSQGGGGFGNSYLWNPGGLTGNFQNVIPTVTTTYTVVVTNNAGCTNTDSITVVVLPATVAYFGYTIAGYTVHFVDSSSNATSWLWSFGDGNLSFNQSPTYTYSADGWYHVQLIVSNGVCAGDTIQLWVPVGAVGIEELNSNNDLLLYPNPGSNFVTIEWITYERETSLYLVNSLGQTIVDRSITNLMGTNNKQQIDVNNLPAGVYSIRIKSDSQNIIKSFVKL